MKHIIITFILNFVFLLNLNAQSLTEAALPLRARNFLNANFPGNSIENISIYQGGGGYEVGINFGYTFIFYNTGLWKKISMTSADAQNGIPRSCLHKSIINVIDNKYPASKITDIERRNKDFIVVLDNKYQLEISGYGIIVNQTNLEAEN